MQEYDEQETINESRNKLLIQNAKKWFDDNGFKFNGNNDDKKIKELDRKELYYITVNLAPLKMIYDYESYQCREYLKYWLCCFSYDSSFDEIMKDDFDYALTTIPNIYGYEYDVHTLYIIGKLLMKVPELLHNKKKDEKYIVGAALIYISMIYSFRYDLEYYSEANYPAKRMPTIQRALSMVYERMENKDDNV